MSGYVGVFLRAHIPQIHTILHTLSQALSPKNIIFEMNNPYGFEGEDLAVIEQKCDFLISLGGDGTLISTLGKIHSLPILGINAGRLGFLTGIGISQIQSFFSSENDYRIEKHAMLSLYLDDHLISYCLNEVVISKKSLPTMVQIEARIDGKPLNCYRCDGLIVATPTGSTAYNISAGGSVVYPYCKNILLTPLAPHSLTQRAMVLSDEVELEFRVLEDSKIIIDGQREFSFSPSQVLRVCFEEQYAHLIYPKQRDYFEVLREKFHWGEQ
ncbi:NAD(+) kinase [Helicobacter pylori]